MLVVVLKMFSDVILEEEVIGWLPKEKVGDETDDLNSIDGEEEVPNRFVFTKLNESFKLSRFCLIVAGS